MLKRFSRGTTSRFSKKGTEVAKSAPTAPPPETAPPAETKAAATKEAESAEQETDNVDESIAPTATPVRQQLSKKAPQAKEGQELTGDQTTTNVTGTEGIYHLTWRAENSYHLTPVRFARTNTFIPSAIPMFKYLEAAERRLALNKHIQTHEPNYVPYAVKVYYAIMYYIQILECKKAAGTLEGEEASLLNRFDKKYPRAGLPCAEIVYGYFNTIHSTELADEKYDWITPDISEHLFRTHATNSYDGATIHTTGVQYLQPHIPMMVANLNNFIQSTSTGIHQHMTDGVYTPISLNNDHNDKIVFGITIRDNTATNNDFKPMLQACGISSPFTFGNDNYQDARKYAKESDFGYNVKVTVTGNDVDPNANLVQQYIFSDLDLFLFMGKRQQGYSNLKWFGYLREQAIIHARFFDQVYHFTDVQTVGGLENTMLCKLRLDTGTSDYHDRYYHDMRLGLGQSASWYRQPFRDLTAGYATSRAGVRRNEELQALCYGTNSSLPIITRATQGTDFDDDADLATGPLRKGKFWKNEEWIRQFAFETVNTTGKPMFGDVNSVALRCIRDKPHGTGIVDNEF